MTWTFIGGVFAGYVLAYVKYVFDAEKSRFEFKTKILSEVWRAVLLAKSCSVNLEPLIDEVDPKESPEERLERRMKEFLEAYKEARRVVRFNQPFYPAAIHDLADSILLEAKMNSKLVGGSPKPSDFDRRRDEYKDTLDEMSGRLCDDIREEANRPSWKLW